MQPGLEGPFYRETSELEGNIEHMYCDTLGIVTVGLGHNIDTGTGVARSGLNLPFRRYSDGSWAPEDEIKDEYARIKAARLSASQARPVVKLYMTAVDRAEDFEMLVVVKEATIKSFLPDWDKMPAHAQMAVLSMGWNLGSYFLKPDTKSYWPQLHAQLKAGDYLGAAGNCKISNVEAKRRNAYNRANFVNAARRKYFNYALATFEMSKLRFDISRLKVDNPPAQQDAWNVQYCLKEIGHYDSVIDGDFGVLSRRAWAAYCKSVKIDPTFSKASINRLGQDANVLVEVFD